MTLLTLLFLYLSFRLKQLLCDYIQPHWMAVSKAKSLSGEGGKALAFHAGIHAIGTLIIMMIFAPQFWWLALVDFIIHGSFDRLKSLLLARKKWSMDSTKFWFAFGLDQEAHNLTHLAYIVFVFLQLNPDLAKI